MDIRFRLAQNIRGITPILKELKDLKNDFVDRRGDA